MDSNDITAQVSGEQKHNFNLWGLKTTINHTKIVVVPWM
jgi:hypothetical protein